MKVFFQKVWNDIKKRENLDLYITLIAVILVFTADIIGIVDYSAITEVILATLAALLYILIKSQHNDERIEQKIDSFITNMGTSKGDAFSPFERHQFTERLLKAKELCMLSISGNYGLLQQHENELRDFIKSGGVLRFVLMEPTSDAFRMASIRFKGYDNEDELKRARNEVDLTIGLLKKLHEVPHAREQVQAKFTTLVSTGIITVFDHNEPTGVAYVTFYGINQSSERGPSITLQKKDSEWFNYFVSTFENTWTSQATSTIDFSSY
jgi:hypothetical protein